MSPALVALIGGSSLLVFSIEELSKSIQYVAGSRFRTWINAFTGNRIASMLLGIMLSLLLSSSGAVTVMLVGLANARLLSLEQVFAVILGASIGTTFIVHLFAFNISQYGLLIIALGVLISSLASSDRLERVARGILYLGLMFYSMALVSGSAKDLETNELFNYTINYFRDQPVVSFLIATILTALIHSSAATIAFVMALMASRHASLAEAIPWVLGANVGTTTTAFFASFKGGTLGKQAAVGHLMCKLVGAAFCIPFVEYLVIGAGYFGGDLSRQIANVHTLFNVFVAALFFPFLGLGVSMVRRFVPEKKEDGPFTFFYLDPRTLESPELALAQAQREILRLSDTVEQMVEKSISVFKSRSDRDVEQLKEKDQVVDFLNRGIKLYLTKLSQKEMTPEQVQREFELLLRTNDLENIGDIVDKNILELVKKQIKKGYTFSAEGWREITTFHSKVVECLRLSTAYFTSHDPALAAKLKLQFQQIEDLILELSEQHVQRLHRGVKESLDTTSIHLDILGNLHRIAGLAVNFTRVRGFVAHEEELNKI